MNERRSLFPAEIDTATLDAGWKAIGEKRRAARTRRRVMLATPLVAAVGLVLLLVFGRVSMEAPHDIALAGGMALPTQWAPAAADVVALDDGSRLEVAAGAVLRTLGNPDPAKVQLALESGSTTFDIRPGGPRIWTIEAGHTHVRVLGTRFTVVHDALHTRVSVERGKVRVEDAHIVGGARELLAGEELDISFAVTATAPSTPPPDVPTPRTIAPSDLPSAEPPAEHSAKKSAPPPITTTHANTVDDADPMDRADAARRAGQPREALAILAAIVNAGGPNASLAAFTTGKVQSESLGDFGAAAPWFERSIELGLPAALDDDAHARVVECYGRAGRADEAAAAAARYVVKYPAGRNLARVKRWTK